MKAFLNRGGEEHSLDTSLKGGVRLVLQPTSDSAISLFLCDAAKPTGENGIFISVVDVVPPAIRGPIDKLLNGTFYEPTEFSFQDGSALSLRQEV